MKSIVARTLLGAPGLTTRSKDATVLGAPGIATSSKDATSFASTLTSSSVLSGRARWVGWGRTLCAKSWAWMWRHHQKACPVDMQKAGPERSLSVWLKGGTLLWRSHQKQKT